MGQQAHSINNTDEQGPGRAPPAQHPHQTRWKEPSKGPGRGVNGMRNLPAPKGQWEPPGPGAGVCVEALVWLAVNSFCTGRVGEVSRLFCTDFCVGRAVDAAPILAENGRKRPSPPQLLLVNSALARANQNSRLPSATRTSVFFALPDCASLAYAIVEYEAPQLTRHRTMPVAARMVYLLEVRIVSRELLWNTMQLQG